MSKTIEIMESDTFFRSDSGGVGIQRGLQYRWISNTAWHPGNLVTLPITRAEFETIAGICGYTVVEAAPPMPEVPTVPFPTWGVQFEDGSFQFAESEEAARKWETCRIPNRLVRFGGAT